MRRRLFALENAVPAATPTEADQVGEEQVISLEEEEVVLAEAADDSASIERDLAEADRVLEVSDGLESIAVVADRIEEASPEDVALIDTAAQMAVAGTDIAPEQIVPAMESFVGSKIATEGIRETSKQIWESIQAFLKRIWDNIMAYFRVHAAVPVELKKIAALEAKIKEAGKQKDGVKTFKLSSGLLTVEGKMVKNAAALGAALRDYEQAAEFVYSKNPEIVAAHGKAIAGVIDKFTAETSNEVTGKLVDVLKGLKHGTVPGASAGKAEGDFTVYSGKDLLGGGRVQLRVFNAAEGATTLGALDHFRKSGVVFDAEQAKAAAGEVEFPVLAPLEAEGLLETAKDILKQLSDFHSKELGKLKAAGDELRKASAKATSELGKVSHEDKGQAAVVQDFRAALNFNQAYSKWVAHPAIQFYGKSLAVSKALRLVVAKSLEAYESKEAAPKTA